MKKNPPTNPTFWMEGDEGRVKERRVEDGQNILKISTFHEPSPLLYSPLPHSPSIPITTRYIVVIIVLWVCLEQTEMRVEP